MGCPYKKECATIIYWSEEKSDFIRLICSTNMYTECLHYFASLKPQHDERERLYGDPHAHEPDWDLIAKERSAQRRRELQ